jgi:ssDNA-binding Zn-finger/Zn-ribbon topoisomerase 1
MELISARWATPKEVENFFNSLKKNKKDKNEFTYKWLFENGNQFIELHSSFRNDWIKHIKQKSIERSLFYLEQRKQMLKEYEDKKINLGRCICQGNLKVVRGDGYEFIGCDNYREQGYDHTKIYKPYVNDFIDYDTLPEFTLTSHYLSKLKEFYNLPKTLKVSILVEFLIMNDIELLYPIQEYLKIGVTVSKASKTRENIVLPFLKKYFDKVYAQKMIIAKFTDTNQYQWFPDFICLKDNLCYIVEQKKNEDNINEYQTDRYLQALKYIAKSNNKTFDFRVLYIIEEGKADLTKSIINIKQISEYEFN